MEFILDNFDILESVENRRKASNMKTHFSNMVKQNKEDDSQVILFKLLIDMNEENKKLRDSIDKKVDNSYYETMIQDMKVCIENKDRKRIHEFDHISDVLSKDIEQKESIYYEYIDNLETYKKSISIRINNYNRTFNNSCPEYLQIYSRQSYLFHTTNLQKAIDKEHKNNSSVAVIRLKRFQEEYIKNKSLKIFQ
jgi:hypothetical protein|tara:strand:+ start:26 stop:610 length:585 start_codon:yes stop_codon:yes gene_type:complete